MADATALEVGTPAPTPEDAGASQRVVAAEAALTRAVTQLSGADHDALAGQLAARALELGLTWERKEGGYDPVALMLRPRIWTASQASYVQKVCLAILGALEGFYEVWSESAALREIMPVSAYEAEKLRVLTSQQKPRSEFLFARLDAIIDGSSEHWVDTLAFLEPNVVGVGGTRYTALGEKLWQEVAHPRLRSGVQVAPQVDSRRLLLDALLDRAHQIGLSGPIRFAMVEDLRDSFGTNELRIIADYFTEQGHPTWHVDVQTLTHRDGKFFADGHEVDFVYRFPELRELEEIDRNGALDGLWEAFRQQKVVSTLTGDLDHKSFFEVLSTPEWTNRYPSATRALFHRHILWTRAVFARKTAGPTGLDIDLPTYIRDRRESLVLKPNRSYGGDRVYIGVETSQAEWGLALAAALEEPASFVVQQFRPVPRQGFPVRDGNAWRTDELAMVCGFYATQRGIASMGRVSHASVVNLSRTGSALVPHITLAD